MLSTLREQSIMEKIGISVNSAGDLPAGKALVTKNGETEVVNCPFQNCKVCMTKRNLKKKEEEEQEKQNNVIFQIKEMPEDVAEPVDNSVQEPVDNSVQEPVNDVPEVGESLNDTAKRLISYNIENQNDALNVMVGFIGLAQTRGAFSIEEAAKLHECIKLFQA
jgi:hypothetical protein